MNFRLFGFQFGRDETDVELNSPITPDKNESSVDIMSTAPGFISPTSTAIDLSGQVQTENEFITRYREIALQPEVDGCVEEIASEAIIYPDDADSPVTLNLEKLEVDDSFKELIIEEFDRVQRLLNFRQKGHDIFKRWYVDGRVNYHALIDFNNVKEGIQSVRYIDPRKIKKIREMLMDKDPSTGNMVIVDVKEYYIFNENGLKSDKYNNVMNVNSAIQAQQNNVVLTTDSVIYCDSGLMEPNLGIVISHLHKALRPASNLAMMEDAMIIYRLARAPERRVFYIDTGNLPKAKAEQYVDEIAKKHKNKVVYDQATGAIKNDKRYMAMTEDYWLPRREGTRGTEIDTLQGGEQVGETGESEYFKDKLYKSLNVPASRFSDQPSIFSSGTEITRDELRFSRFIDRLRAKFNDLWLELLGRQLILKGYITLEEWEDLKGDLQFDYAQDTFFAEALKSQLLLQRMSILEQVDPFVGRYFSREFVFTKVLNMTEEEWKEELTKIAAELPEIQQLEQTRFVAMNPEIMMQQKTQTESVTDESALNSLIESELQVNETITKFLDR